MDDGLFDVWYTVRGTKAKVGVWGVELLEKYPASVYGTRYVQSNHCEEDGIVEDEWHRHRLPIGDGYGKSRA